MAERLVESEEDGEIGTESLRTFHLPVKRTFFRVLKITQSQHLSDDYFF